MRRMAFAFLALVATAAASAQQEPAPLHVGAGPTMLSDVSNLPRGQDR